MGKKGFIHYDYFIYSDDSNAADLALRKSGEGYSVFAGVMLSDAQYTNMKYVSEEELAAFISAGKKIHILADNLKIIKGYNF